jgi:CubicO group peptidase (beta-lactamase class C family)
MIKVIESQEPAWPPETKGAYNTVNIGYMAGEIVRRVSGLSIRDFVQKNICTPLNAEFKIGVDKEDLDRVADICPNSAGFSMKSAATPGTPLARAWKAMPSTMNAATHNTTDFRLGALPSFGGFGTARGIARIYAALANGGEIDGVQLATSKTIKKATEDQWHDESDGTTGQEIRMGIGFFKNTNHLFGPNADSFGHHGSGGTRALADPSENLSLGFVSNLMSEKLGTGIRTEAIVKAAYSNL